MTKTSLLLTGCALAVAVPASVVGLSLAQPDDSARLRSVHGAAAPGPVVGIHDAGDERATSLPGTGGLDPDLDRALLRAAAAARADGIAMVVNSGRRTPAHQQELLDAAVAKYGSLAEASRWVATPETSSHVSGDAVDLGPEEATEWLARHGAAYGLCQIYGNEPWHYELRPTAVDAGCPQMYADPTEDPRMQR